MKKGGAFKDLYLCSGDEFLEAQEEWKRVEPSKIYTYVQSLLFLALMNNIK